jgi:hypothetical protein
MVGAGWGGSAGKQGTGWEGKEGPWFGVWVGIGDWVGGQVEEGRRSEKQRPGRGWRRSIHASTRYPRPPFLLLATPASHDLDNTAPPHPLVSCNLDQTAPPHPPPLLPSFPPPPLQGPPGAPAVH